MIKLLSAEITKWLAVQHPPVPGRIPTPRAAPDMNPVRYSLAKLYLSMARSVSLRWQFPFLRPIGFWLEDLGDIRIRNRGLQVDLNVLVDNMDTGRRSRFGAGLGRLLLEERGYTWFEHFSELGNRIALAGLQPTKTPDVFATGATVPPCFADYKSSATNNLWSREVVPGYRHQVAPWLGASVSGVSINTGFSVGTQISPTNSLALQVLCTSPGQPPGRQHVLVSSIRRGLENWFLLASEYPFLHLPRPRLYATAVPGLGEFVFPRESVPYILDDKRYVLGMSRSIYLQAYRTQELEDEALAPQDVLDTYETFVEQGIGTEEQATENNRYAPVVFRDGVALLDRDLVASEPWWP
ncbi:MAG: hypothetical protein H7Y17_07450 [Chlorobia bacterium]|nr:hypothetical protein [Fimbriimonadaceae bacterium]